METGCTTSKWPAVTAIVNTYKRAALLPRALDSILAQTYRDFELFCVHDGPADADTKQVYADYLPKFQVAGITASFVETDECSGYQCVPKNIGVIHARGDYIAYLDDDNEWTSDHLEVLVRAMEEGDKWPDFAYGRREYVLDAQPEDDKIKLPVGPSEFVPFDNTALERLAASPMLNFIDTSDAIIAKGAMWRLHTDTGAMWNENMRRFGDWELFARGVHFAQWRGKAVDAIVQKYHWHGSNLQLTRPANEAPVLRPARDVADA